MKRWFLAAVCVMGFIPLLAFAQSPLDGTWKANLNNVDWPKKPYVYLLQDGMYECKSCVPPWKVKADGSDQSVTGHPGVDTVAVTVVSDHEVQISYKKGGKDVGADKMTVSSDGNTLTTNFTATNPDTGKSMTGTEQDTRIAKGPSGSNAVSRSWRTTKLENLSENGATWSYKVNGNEVTMTTAMGETFTAKMDGTEAPMKGNPGVTSISFKSTGKDKYEQTSKRDGKVIEVEKMSLSADGKTMSVVAEDKLHNTVTKFTATKQ